MANIKISELPLGTTPLSGTEEIPIVQDGQTVKVTTSDIGGYKLYAALLQDAVSSVLSTELANTLGFAVSWQYISTGFYGSVSSQNFDDTKTTILTNVTNANVTVVTNVGDNRIYITTYETDTNTLSDGLMNNMSIEVKVYN